MISQAASPTLLSFVGTDEFLASASSTVSPQFVLVLATILKSVWY